ncbi:hypothetical protein BGZ96_007574 [Linnemannia gamsii]|uniref:Uncharacterized protein n=1 Tax=Linnemannia gamsii TaxID=64522 RepID=A0ABQ7JZY8_9FUNG|nr:hypothetical protein BGZ96_007574 [Linnemannia gamsii]
MTCTFVRHSLLVAIALIVVCSAAPAPVPLHISDPDLGSLGSDLLANPDEFGSALGALGRASTPSDLLSGGAGLDSFVSPIQVGGAGGDLVDPAFSSDLLNGGTGVGIDSVAAPADQFVPSQTVHLSSQTEIVPTTGVFPNLIFQPAIQLYDPLVNNFQTYGVGPAFTNSYAVGRLGGGGLGLASFEKRQIGPMGPPGPVSPALGGFGPGGPMGSPPTIVNGAPADVSTDQLIRPIVNIQPHALQPVPVPVGTPYDYPVPVGVSVPVGPVGGGGWGKWGGGWGDWDGGFGNDWNW